MRLHYEPATDYLRVWEVTAEGRGKLGELTCTPNGAFGAELTWMAPNGVLETVRCMGGGGFTKAKSEIARALGILSPALDLEDHWGGPS